MEQIKCLNCKELITVDKIQAGLNATCDCGCMQRCLYAGETSSNWRVMNPFDFEDKRDLNNK